MAYASIAGEVATELYGQPFEIGDTQYPGNVVMLWRAEELAALGILPIVEPDSPPVGQVVVSSALAVVDGRPVRTVEYGAPPPPIVPAKIHKLWVVAVLTAWDVIDAVEDRLDSEWAAGNKGYKRYWNAVGDVYRSDPVLGAFAAAFGWSAEQLDQIFIQAAGYEAAAAYIAA